MTAIDPEEVRESIARAAREQRVQDASEAEAAKDLRRQLAEREK